VTKTLGICLGLLLSLPGRSATLKEANALLEAKQYEAAAEAYQKLGEQASKKREGWRLNNWGLALLRQNKPAQAVEPLEKAVAADSRNFTAWSNLGAAYERVGDRVKASDIYQKALDLLQTETKALQSGKKAADAEAAENLAAAGDTLAAKAEEKASALKGEALKEALKKAAEMLDRGRYQEAAAAYAEIGSTAPAKREGWRLNNWGLCFLRLGDAGSARSRLERSVEVFPDNPVAWNNLGVAYEALGLADKAKEAYGRAAGSSGEADHDPVRSGLNRLKLDFAAERRRWEAMR
jgi:superkiller protein 3